MLLLDVTLKIKKIKRKKGNKERGETGRRGKGGSLERKGQRAELEQGGALVTGGGTWQVACSGIGCVWWVSGA